MFGCTALIFLTYLIYKHAFYLFTLSIYRGSRPPTIKKERNVTQKTVSKGENTFQVYRERNQAILTTLDLKGDDKITFSTTAKFLKDSSQHRPLCMVVG